MSTNEPPAHPGDSTQPPAGSYPPPGGFPTTNGKATASMVTGIASLVLGLFCGLLIVGSVVAIVLGFIARGEIARSQGTQKGDGRALTGIITGFALLILFVLLVIGLATGAIDYDFNVEG